MSPAEAFRFHENIFLLKEDYVSLANSSVNPTKRTVYYLYDIWREENYGKQDDFTPLEKLKQKLALYKLKGKFSLVIIIIELR